MPLDNFDKKIQHVTQNNQPSFDETNWIKMEMMLNKNLPIKNDRRRFLLILFSFLLLSLLIGGIYFINNSFNKKTSNTSNSKKSKPNDTANSRSKMANTKTAPKNTTAPIPKIILTKKESDSNENVRINKKGNLQKTAFTVNEESPHRVESSKTLVSSNAQISKPLAPIGLVKLHPNKVIEYNDQIDKVAQANHQHNKITVDNIAEIGSYKQIPTRNLPTKNKYSKEKTLPVDGAIHQTFKEDSMLLVSTVVKSIVPTPDSIVHPSAAINKKLIKNNAAQKNQFAFTLTSGFESSGTKLNSQGKLTTLYGFGFQYSIGKKILLRTGVHVVKKIYTAQDGDYKAPPGSWAFNVTFKDIHANCKVLEIPLSVAYKIKEYKKGSLYGSIGFSSFIMKKENYQFYFKGQNGNDTTRAALFVNNSNHLFSSLNVTVIADKKITDRLSLSAEPFIKVPLGGIGFGRVKLFNTGILLTAKFKIR